MNQPSRALHAGTSARRRRGPASRQPAQRVHQVGPDLGDGHHGGRGDQALADADQQVRRRPSSPAIVPKLSAQVGRAAERVLQRRSPATRRTTLTTEARKAVMPSPAGVRGSTRSSTDDQQVADRRADAAPCW